MKEIMVVAWVRVDDTNPLKNVVTREEVRLAVEDAITTPDNEAYGIEAIHVKAFESTYLQRMAQQWEALPSNAETIL